MRAADATALRRTAALLVDAALPVVPAAVLVGLAWTLVRPDRAEGMRSLGAVVLLMGVALLAWVAGFVVNDVGIASRRDGTIGDRLLGFALELPERRGPRVLRLVARAVLRGCVVWLALSAVGLVTQLVGEDVLGVTSGAAVAVLLLIGVCRLGAHGPTTIVERVVGVEVRDEGRRSVRPPA